MPSDHPLVSYAHRHMPVLLADVNAACSRISYWHDTVVCLSVCLCNKVYCGTQDQCRGLKVVPSCSWEGTFYSLLQTLSVQCVRFQCKQQYMV